MHQTNFISFSIGRNSFAASYLAVPECFPDFLGQYRRKYRRFFVDSQLSWIKIMSKNALVNKLQDALCCSEWSCREALPLLDLAASLPRRDFRGPAGKGKSGKDSRSFEIIQVLCIFMLRQFF
jgi:hypothetical protein